MGGLPGTALMLAECSGLGAVLDLDRIPLPPGVDLARWLSAFPSYGFLLAVAPPDLPAVLARFDARGIAAAAIGACEPGTRVDIRYGSSQRETCWDFALLAHSTNPRGGVVHAMALAEALHDAGADATLLAPDSEGRGFFRTPDCPFLTIPVRRTATLRETVAARIEATAAFLDAPGIPRFDLHHAQDPITANALADLAARGAIPGFVRTVHHLDRFADPQLAAWQERGMRAASRLAVVSRCWRDRLLDRHGRQATVVGNGVDMRRFGPNADTTDAPLRRRLGLDGATGPVILALGGIEERKNTLGALGAVLRLRAGRHPDAHLVIAGGATLLDHGAYRRRFDATLATAGDGARGVTFAGVVGDRDMPALYRLADVLACASLAEGFGLTPLEALATGRPAVVSAVPPFTEHFGAGEVVWTDPADPGAIASALALALERSPAFRLSGPKTAARFDWREVARAHARLHVPFAAQARTPALA